MTQRPPDSPAHDVWTYRKILDWTQEKLRSWGSESPRVEAEILLAHAARCQRILLYTRLDEPTPEDVRTTMRDLVQRRMKAEPVAYLVGHREFFSLDFFVTSATLVPRPETETLVMAALAWLEKTALAQQDEQPKRTRVLDVGTGTGCVPIAIAKQRHDVEAVGVDICRDALSIASKNIVQHELKGRVSLSHGDVFDSVADQTFDLITSNPPYIREDEYAGLEADVRDHEPRHALVAGDDGLDVVRRLIAGGIDRLTPGGAMLLEIDPAQMDVVDDLFQTHGWADVVRHKDANGDERVIGAARR